jgi:signal transduction histidine kinase
VAGYRSFADAVLRVARDTEIATGAEVRVALDGELIIRLGTCTTELVKIIREALSNATRHGNARNCTVSLVPFAGAAMLAIRDDGRGFHPETADPGDGIQNMCDRTAALGGRFEIISANGGPTTVCVRLPLPVGTLPAPVP